jgi:uncharacterized RDD family membrane protein YckC
MSGPGPGSEQQPQQPAPQQPAGPPPGPGPAAPPSMPAWTGALTSTAPTPGPAGLFYADVPNRVIAIIIDYIILAVVGFVVSIVLYSILGNPTRVISVPDPNSFLGVRFDTQTNYLSALVFAAVNIAISAGYFVYTWTAMRGTLGMKVLGMQVGNQTDGSTITMDQAIRRWLALGGIFALVQALANLPLLGLLVWLASIAWIIALLVTTAQSPTKQGLHDQFAGTMVVKAARSVA